MFCIEWCSGYCGHIAARMFKPQKIINCVFGMNWNSDLWYVILCLGHHLNTRMMHCMLGRLFGPTSTSYYSWKVSSCLSSSSFVCYFSSLIALHLTLFLFSSSKDMYTFKTPVYLCLTAMFADSLLVPVEYKQTEYTMVTTHPHPWTNILNSHFDTCASLFYNAK